MANKLKPVISEFSSPTHPKQPYAVYDYAEALRSLGVQVPYGLEIDPNEPVEQVVARLNAELGGGVQGNNEMIYVHARSAMTGENAQVPPVDPANGAKSPTPATAPGYAQSGDALRPLTQSDLNDLILRQSLWDYGEMSQSPKLYLEQGFDGEKLPKWALGAFESPLTVADILSNKGEVYTQDVWNQNLPRLDKLAQSGKLVGRIDHPAPGSGVLGGCALQFTQVYWGGDRSDGGKELWGRGYILNTQGGNDLTTMLQAGVPVDISSRGYGRTTSGSWQGRIAQIVQHFICDGFDAVLDGASPGAGFTSGSMKWQSSGGPLSEGASVEIPTLEPIPPVPSLVPRGGW